MFRHILVTTALMSFTLFTMPSMGLTDNPSPQSGLDGKTVEVARAGLATKDESQSLARKRPQITEPAENVDCFYEANSASPDCAVAKPGQE